MNNSSLIVSGLDNYELTEEKKKDSSIKRASGETRTSKNVYTDEVKFREFVIGDLFHKVDLKRIKKTFDKANDVSKEQTAEYSLPLVNAKNGDNGIMYYGRPEDWESDTYCIDIVNDGAVSAGNVYPQPQRTGVLYNAYLIKPNDKIESEEILIYLAKSIEKVIKSQFGYDNKATWEKVKEQTINLPVTPGGTPDWDFMQSFINGLKQERIGELEQKQIREFESYLIASGLDDYEFTEDEKKVLSLFLQQPYVTKLMLRKMIARFE